MSSRMTFVTALLALSHGFAAGEPEDPGGHTWEFDTDGVGTAPAGFNVAVGEWKIVEDATAPSGKRALAQLAKNPGPVFNLTLAREASCRDVDIFVALNSIAGEIDQGGGVVWRAQDARNYYIARYNPLEDNYRVYKVVSGKRTQLQNADIKRSPGWHTLRVAMKGERIECYYDGKRYLDVKDSTFKGPGKVGLWTKADAQTHFDTLTVSSLGGSSLWSFDADEPGAVARGFTEEVGQWKIVADQSAPSKSGAFAQLAENPRPVFNVALEGSQMQRNLEISVKLKSVAGQIDQGGGVVWRARDARNYYIARYNPLEDNYRVYKVVSGKRTQLQNADIRRSPGWHTLSVTMKGERIECYYDGKRYLDVTDSTFTEPGKIGLWTKADAKTHFDDLRVTILKSPLSGADR